MPQGASLPFNSQEARLDCLSLQTDFTRDHIAYVWRGTDPPHFWKTT